MRGWVRWLIVPVVVAPIAWLLFQGFGLDPRAIESPMVGQSMPDFGSATLDGGELDADELRGGPVLLNFWASWCGPCVAEHAVLADASERYGNDVRIVGVLYQDTPADALDFLARYGDFGWPNLVDPNGQLAIEYGLTGPPASFFIDADGIVRDHHIGPLTDEVLAAKLEPLLAVGRSDR